MKYQTPQTPDGQRQRVKHRHLYICQAHVCHPLWVGSGIIIIIVVIMIIMKIIIIIIIVCRYAVSIKQTEAPFQFCSLFLFTHRMTWYVQTFECLIKQ